MMTPRFSSLPSCPRPRRIAMITVTHGPLSTAPSHTVVISQSSSRVTHTPEAFGGTAVTIGRGGADSRGSRDIVSEVGATGTGGTGSLLGRNLPHVLDLLSSRQLLCE